MAPSDIDVLVQQVLAEYSSDEDFIAVCVAGARVAVAWDRFRDALHAYTDKHPREASCA